MKNSIFILVVSFALSTVSSLIAADTKPGTVLWEWTSKDAKPVGTPALGYDGKIYVNTPHSGKTQLMAVIDPISGKEIVYVSKDGAGGTTTVSPTILPNGGAILPYNAGVIRYSSKAENKVELVWKRQIGGGYYDAGFTSAALGRNGLVYLTTLRHRKILAYDINTGDIKWEFLGRNQFYVSPTIGSDGTVYAGETSGYFYALDGKTGALKWKYEDKKLSQFGGGGVHQHTRNVEDAILDGSGTLFITGESSSEKGRGLLAALKEKDGSRIWERLFPNTIYAPVMDENGILYLGSEDNNIYAVNSPDGKVLWSKKIAKTRTSPAVGNDGVIYIASLDNYIYGIDSKNGEVKWEVRTGDANISSPLLDNKGNLYVGSNDGRLYAIATSSTGPAKSPWPMYAQNAQRTHRPLTKSELAAFSKPEAKTHSKTVPVFPKPNVKPGTILWEWISKDARPVSTPALGYDGNIYVPTENREQTIATIDRITGREKGHSNIGGLTRSHEGPNATPSITDNGSVIIPIEHALTLLTGTKLKVKWEQKDFGGGNWPTAAVSKGDFAYYAGYGDKYVYSVNLTTGKKQWSYLTKNHTRSVPVVCQDDDVYVGSQDAIFYALDGATGKVKWKYTNDQIGAFGGGRQFYADYDHAPAIDERGWIYAPCNSINGRGMLLALDKAKGELKWAYVDERSEICSPVIGKEGHIYFATAAGQLVSLNRDSGKVNWKSSGKIGDIRSTLAIGDDGTIYFGSKDRYIYAVSSADGKVKWKIRTGDIVITSPLIDNVGSLYVGGRDGRLYAIATSSTGPAKSAWPMYGQNAQRTHRAPAVK